VRHPPGRLPRSAHRLAGCVPAQEVCAGARGSFFHQIL